jgi:hypothetical protein
MKKDSVRQEDLDHKMWGAVPMIEAKRALPREILNKLHRL